MAVIRIASPQDANAIARVHVASWRSTYRGIVPDAYLDTLDEDQRAAMWRDAANGSHGPNVHLLVAEEKGQIAGFLCAGPIREAVENYDAELYAIYLLAEAQGQGIGTALLKALVPSLVSAGLHSMAVWVLAANDSARFYTKTGAVYLDKKQIEIGGIELTELAYGWPSLTAILDR